MVVLYGGTWDDTYRSGWDPAPPLGPTTAGCPMYAASLGMDVVPIMTTTRGSRPTIPRLSPASLFSFQPIPDYGAAKQRARRPDEVSPWPGHLLALLGGRCVSYLQVATQVS